MLNTHSIVGFLSFLLLAWIVAFASGNDAALRRIQSTHQDFGKGSFGDAGANMYVSADGRIHLINRWDLNQDGYIDLVFNNSHLHVEKLDAVIYWGNGKDFDARQVAYLPNDGAHNIVAADLNGD